MRVYPYVSVHLDGPKMCACTGLAQRLGREGSLPRGQVLQPTGKSKCSNRQTPSGIPSEPRFQGSGLGEEGSGLLPHSRPERARVLSARGPLKTSVS